MKFLETAQAAMMDGTWIQENAKPLLTQDLVQDPVQAQAQIPVQDPAQVLALNLPQTVWRLMLMEHANNATADIS